MSDSPYSATNFAFSHSFAPLCFHYIRFSKFSSFPLRSRISSTSAYSNNVPSKTLITPSSLILRPNYIGFPFGVTSRISLARSNVVLPRLSATSGSALGSRRTFATLSLTYLVTMCSTSRLPLRSQWFRFAPTSASNFMQGFEPSPATKKSMVQPSDSSSMSLEVVVASCCCWFWKMAVMTRKRVGLWLVVRNGRWWGGKRCLGFGESLVKRCLGLDFGTSGAKFAIIDKDGTIQAEAKRKCPFYLIKRVDSDMIGLAMILRWTHILHR
ncbi:hypothetical protein GmHk_07G019072 [Glycine max]|nr:hypothetical protein GmHk_07G019072 [Glycine max]